MKLIHYTSKSLKTILLLSTLLLGKLAVAQQPTTFSLSTGKAKAWWYAENIIRIDYEPLDYKTTERITDAVVAKPVIRKAIPLTLKNDVLQTLEGMFISCTPSGFRITLKQGEKIFGGGERALPLNRRGQRLELYNNPSYGYSLGADKLNYSVPFITSSEGYGLFFDNASKGYFDIGKAETDILEIGASSGALTLYIISGSPSTILSSFHKLTGTQPLPPRWAFGNLMSRFGYTSEAQAKEIYQKMKDEKFPVDAIIFDLFWFGDSIKGTMGNLDWVNKNRWPNPAKMIADFKREGVNTILVTEPFFLKTSKNYSASLPFSAVDSAGKPYTLTDFYFGAGGLVDIFRKDARQWFWSFYKKQMDIGVEGWWGDLGEPEKHPTDLYHNLSSLGYKRLFSADEVHNAYGHYWTKMLYDNYAISFPKKRLFTLNRSGFAGTQRYGIIPWTGDVSRSWSGLQAQLPVLLGMSMSGIPYVHSDAGGFAGGQGDEELYVRWLQLAAFTPIFRPHGTALYDVDPGAFSFPSEPALMQSPFKESAGGAIKTRYRYLPYNYSLGWQQWKVGKPLIAPLYYHFPSDTTALEIQDQFLWGDAILVVPVLIKGQAFRNYYLPDGLWYHTGREQILEGGKWYMDNPTLEQIGILYREGSFVTLSGKSEMTNTSTFKGDSLRVIYTPSEKPSIGEVYFDDGVTKTVTASGEVLTFKSSGIQNGRLRISISSNGRTYAGKPLSRRITLQLAGDHEGIEKVRLNGKDMGPRGTNEMHYEFPKLELSLLFTGKKMDIEIFL